MHVRAVPPPLPPEPCPPQTPSPPDHHLLRPPRMWTAVSDAAEAPGTTTCGTTHVPDATHVAAAAGARTQEVVLPIVPPWDASSLQPLAVREAVVPTAAPAGPPHRVSQGPGTFAQMSASWRGGGPPEGLAVSHADPLPGVAPMDLDGMRPPPAAGPAQAVTVRSEAVRGAEGGSGAGEADLDRLRGNAGDAAVVHVREEGVGPLGASGVLRDAKGAGEAFQEAGGGLSHPSGSASVTGLPSGQSRETGGGTTERGSGRAGVPSWRDADSEDSEPLPDIASGSSSSDEDDSGDDSDGE